MQTQLLFFGGGFFPFPLLPVNLSQTEAGPDGLIRSTRGRWGFFGPQRRVFSPGAGLKSGLEAVPGLPALAHDVTTL